MPAQAENVADTLAGGLQDMSAVIPLIGTKSCETQVGSALQGGYLYTAAAPLSIFGCLGIFKAGLAVLISSIYVPRIPAPLRKRYKTLLRDRRFGTRILSNIGIKLPGTVAPLIAMDGNRYRAETQLLEILEKKNIDDPKNISIEWNLDQWNVKLTLSTLLAGIMSTIPYIYLIMGPISRDCTPFPLWLPPLIRAVGSCLASVCIQLLIQSRIIFLMKNRILFMTIHHRLIANVCNDNKTDFDSWLRDWLHWDADLPSEECISSLEQFLSSRTSLSKPPYKDDPKGPDGYVAINVDETTFVPPPPHDALSEDQIDCDTIQHLRDKHFSKNNAYDHYTTLFICLLLFFSLPAILIGYIGCFRLVKASTGRRAFIWLGLEAMLSIVRLIAWALSPRPGTEAGMAIPLRITQHSTKSAADAYTLGIYDQDDPEKNPCMFSSGSKFMKILAPYTLPGLQSAENVTSNFSLTPADDGSSAGSGFLDGEEEFQSPWSLRCGCQQSSLSRR